MPPYTCSKGFLGPAAACEPLQLAMMMAGTAAATPPSSVMLKGKGVALVMAVAVVVIDGVVGVSCQVWV